jgi:hypothetical protein
VLSKLRTRLRALLRKSEMERELDEELRHHIEQQTEQNIRLGMNPEEALCGSQGFRRGGTSEGTAQRRETEARVRREHGQWSHELPELRSSLRSLSKNF